MPRRKGVEEAGKDLEADMLGTESTKSRLCAYVIDAIRGPMVLASPLVSVTARRVEAAAAALSRGVVSDGASSFLDTTMLLVLAATSSGQDRHVSVMGTGAHSRQLCIACKF